MDDFLKVFKQGIKELDICLSPGQMEQYLTYCQLLTQWNQKVNLTAVKDEQEIAVKHFLDSLAAGLYFHWDKKGKLLDLGAGAGFPGLVLKIWQPDRYVTMVDSVLKKVNFMGQVIKSLQLGDVAAVHGRVEELGRQVAYREKYSMVTARAVAPLPVLCEYSLPLLSAGGYFYALKGPNYQEELREARYAIDVLGGQLEQVIDYGLPVKGDGRSLIVIKKNNPTPDKYPRKSGIPGKKPLVKS